MPGGGGIGLPDGPTGGPGGGGIGLPDDDVGGADCAPPPPPPPPPDGRSADWRRDASPPPGAGACGRGADGRGGRGPRAAGAAGASERPGRAAGASGRGARAAGASGRGARAAGASGSGRAGRGGFSLPDEVTRRPGGAGGRGWPGGGPGGPGGRGEPGGGMGRPERAAAGRSRAGAAPPPPLPGPPAPPAAGRAGAGVGSDGGADVSAGAGSGAGAGRGSATSGAGAAGSAAAGARVSPFSGRSGRPLAAPDLEVTWLPEDALPPDALTGAGDSDGCSGRVRPSRLARRRTRSAWASSMPDECVLTPMPNRRHRSRASLFVSPSSLASSWTRIFAAKLSLTSPSSFDGRDARTWWRDRGPLFSRTPVYRDERPSR
jgi:hypothetical protein